jgi:dihydroxyacetone kinase
LQQNANFGLDIKWHINPVKIYSGTFESSLNGPGFCITLCNITRAATECKSTASELLELLSDQTAAPSWPNVQSNTSTKVKRQPIPHQDSITKRPKLSPCEDIKGMYYCHTLVRQGYYANQYLCHLVDPLLLDRVIRQGCDRAIAAEPNLTKWDMVMGDGDCGEAVYGVCTGN